MSVVAYSIGKAPRCILS